MKTTMTYENATKAAVLENNKTVYVMINNGQAYGYANTEDKIYIDNLPEDMRVIDAIENPYLNVYVCQLDDLEAVYNIAAIHHYGRKQTRVNVEVIKLKEDKDAISLDLLK